MKYLEETPWFICDKEDTNYCAYVDTDSNYFNAEPLLNHLYPKLSEMDDYYNSKDDSTLPISVNKRNVFKTNKDLCNNINYDDTC